ncbi:MAG TPA: hypothetical protein VGX52_12780 [Burkholderiales bacterium]|nr:hypothetical protein [Burkholderiales bacterium]
MDSDWEKLVKRYVWNDERTPYFTRVANLSRRQAHYELFGYALFVGVLSGVLSVAALSSALPHGDSPAVSLYAFTVCCAAILLGATRHPWAALWSAGAPLAALGYFVLYGFHPVLGTPDKILVVAAMLLWLVYAPRVVAVARAWPGLAGPAEPD